MTDLVTSIDTQRDRSNLSSALRLLVLAHYQKRAASGLVVDNSVRATEYANATGRGRPGLNRRKAGQVVARADLSDAGQLPGPLRLIEVFAQRQEHAFLGTLAVPLAAAELPRCGVAPTRVD